MPSKNEMLFGGAPVLDALRHCAVCALITREQQASTRDSSILDAFLNGCDSLEDQLDQLVGRKVATHSCKEHEPDLAASLLRIEDKD